MKICFYMVLLAVLGNLNYGFAQSIHNSFEVNEEIYVHFNTTSLLSGETLYFKIYCLDKDNGAISNLSKIAYIEIISPTGERIKNEKILLKNGVGYSDFFFAPDIKSGKYKAIAYTKSMLTKNVISATDLVVINPFQELSFKGNLITIDSTSEIASATPSKEYSFFTLEKNTFATREKITLHPSTEFLSDAQFTGSYSVSVRKADQIDALLPVPATNEYAHTLQTVPGFSTKKYAPEIRGEVISGKISGVADYSPKILALSTPGSIFDLSITSSDASGNFNFVVNNPYTGSEIIIQPMQAEAMEIKVDTMQLNYTKINFSNPINFNPALQNSVVERSTANQIENAYFNLRKDSFKIPDNNDLIIFYKPLEVSYNLDDYTRFPTFQETIIEIIPELYIQNRKGKHTLHIRDYENKVSNSLYGETLLLIDGILLKDFDQLYNYKAGNIQHIDVVNTGYIYGSNVYSGVVSVFTKDGSFRPEGTDTDVIYISEFTRPQNEKIYFNQTYDGNKMERIPDYRYQLLWNPDVTDSNNLYCYTSDVTGTFIISVQGFKQDGTPISFEQTFTVK